jgi:hypothetical protein
MRQMADRFMSQTAQFEATSHHTLEQILAMNGATEFGRRCGLDGPTPLQVFENLPTTTYADYAPFIERLAAGETNLLSQEPVVYFSTTSGTTGPPKLIPFTRRFIRKANTERFVSMGLALRAGVLQPMHGPFMTIMTEHLRGTTAGGLPKGAATTGGFKKLGPVADLILSSPTDVMRVHNQTAARYLHLLFGLRQEHLWFISAFFPATILMALRDLHNQGEQLVRDLADGTINPQLELSAEIRDSLQQRMRPEPARARALMDLMEHGRFTVPNIWPQLGGILTATGGSFQFYADQLRLFLEDLPVFSPLYASSESTIGFGFSVDNPYYLLVPTRSYIELLPAEIMDDPLARPIPAWQAEPGCCYEVIVTTLTGFTRYQLNDIVRVVEFCGQTPVIEFVGRRGNLIDIVGEKTAEHHIVEAIAAACDTAKARLLDYFVSPDTEKIPARYLLAIESLHSGADNSDATRKLLPAMEASLRRVASEYNKERELGTLGPMAIVLLKPGAFERHRDQLIAAGASASQVKTPHVVADPVFFRRHFQHEVSSRIEAQGG